METGGRRIKYYWNMSNGGNGGWEAGVPFKWFYLVPSYGKNGGLVEIIVSSNFVF